MLKTGKPHTWMFRLLGVLAAHCFLFPGTTHAQPEVRGIWCSRFQWSNETPSIAQTNITTVLDNMVTGHFNCVFFQIRGQCDTLFPSPYEPWAPMISNPDGTSPGWDPLQYAITGAHSRNLQLHAYFNTHTIWGSATAPALPAYANHVYYTHPEWRLYTDAGVAAAHDGEYIYMNPGIPDGDAHVRKQVAHIVTSYNVDGMHFDRVRMTTAGYGKNPIAVARWDNAGTGTPNDGPGNPEQLGWDAYMRDCVTRQVINITGQCWGIKPGVVMSSSPLGLWDYSAYSGLGGYGTGFYYGYPRGQDAKAWMQMGAQDFIVPQIYWANGGTKPDFNEVFDDWLLGGNAAGRFVVPGSNMSNGHAELESHVNYVRAQGGAGHNIWHSLNTQYSNWSLPGAPYETAAPAMPTFPWRSTEGVITGHVYLQDACSSTTAVDAHITRNGSTWTALASGDGFFSFLKVPPGTYTLTTTHPELATIITSNVVVVAGQATNVEISGPRTPPLPLPNTPTGLNAISGSAGINLTWTDTATGETGFQIYRGTVSGGPYTLVTTTAANAVSYTDAPGASGTYYYVVRATNGCTSSAESNQASGTIVAPTLSAVLVPGQTSVTLNWLDTYSDETHFEIRRSTNPAGPYRLIATPVANATSYIDDAVLYATDTSWAGSFYYTVQVANATAVGPKSNQVTATPVNPPDILLESRAWYTTETITAYSESTPPATWANTAAKSLVINPRGRAPGGRFVGTGSLGNYAIFTPNILLHANYEVLVTGPNAVIGLNVNSPGTEVVVRDGTTTPPITTRTFNNSRFNTALTDQWMAFSPPLIVEFPLGNLRNIRFTNTHTGSNSTGHRFNIDAIRLRFSGFAPVTTSHWELD